MVADTHVHTVVEDKPEKFAPEINLDDFDIDEQTLKLIREHEAGQE